MLTRRTHKKCTIRISADAVSKILNSILESKEATRKGVSQMTGYSDVTVGKVFAGICASGLTYEIVKKPSDGGRVMGHLQYTDDIHFLVIDVCTRLFRMSLVSTSLEVKVQASYPYTDYRTFEKNLSAFLSQGGRILEKLNIAYSEMIVIYENSSKRCCHSSYSAASVDQSSPNLIREMVCEYIGYPPDLMVTPDVVIKQFLLDCEGKKDTGYIFIGSFLSMCNLSRVGNITVGNPWNLIQQNERLYNLVSSTNDPEVFYSAFENLINVLDITFSPKTIYLQSDLFILDKYFTDEICGYIQSKYPSTSQIKTLHAKKQTFAIGAALLLRSHLYKRIIVGMQSNNLPQKS